MHTFMASEPWYCFDSAPPSSLPRRLFVRIEAQASLSFLFFPPFFSRFSFLPLFSLPLYPQLSFFIIINIPTFNPDLRSRPSIPISILTTSAIRTTFCFAVSFARSSTWATILRLSAYAHSHFFLWLAFRLGQLRLRLSFWRSLDCRPLRSRALAISSLDRSSARASASKQRRSLSFFGGLFFLSTLDSDDFSTDSAFGPDYALTGLGRLSTSLLTSSFAGSCLHLLRLFFLSTFDSDDFSTDSALHPFRIQRVRARRFQLSSCAHLILQQLWTSVPTTSLASTSHTFLFLQPGLTGCRFSLPLLSFLAPFLPHV